MAEIEKMVKDFMTGRREEGMHKYYFEEGPNRRLGAEING